MRVFRIALLFAVALLVPVGTALAVPASSTTSSGGLHFVGTPELAVNKTFDTAGNLTAASLTATGEVAGAGKTATAVLSATAAVTSGCINRGSKDQEPSGLERSVRQTSGSQTFNTRSGRGTFEVTTNTITSANARPQGCPDTMRAVLVSVTYTNITLTITSGANKEATATFPDQDP